MKIAGGSAWESNLPKALLTPPNGVEVPQFVSKLLNKLSVTTLAELSNFSKSYISQVKHGKCPHSQKLILAIQKRYGKDTKVNGLTIDKALSLFIQSRREGLSSHTIEFYRCYLERALSNLGLTPKPSRLNNYISNLSCSSGGKHAYYRALRVFYNWLYSAKSGQNLSYQHNPIILVDPPKVEKRILPSLTLEQLEYIIEQAICIRGKAIISLFVDSGLRLSELTNIRVFDIDWENRLIKVWCKGNKEGLAPFGKRTEKFLKEWLSHHGLKDRLWDLKKWGIVEMLQQLKAKTGLPCNPHTFRRTFACLLRKQGIDTMTIKDLGRWESLEMVQHYTRSITFQDSMKFYKAPLGDWKF